MDAIGVAGGLSMRVAVETDVDAVCGLLKDCITAMREAGIDQWDEIYPVERTIRSDVTERTMYVAVVEGAIAAAVVLNEHQDREYLQVPWTIEDVRVGVVHRLMVHPRYQGNGIGREVMTLIEARAYALGYGAVRLDAFSANPRALRLYHGLGYRDAGTVTFRKGEFRCFEKRLTPG